MTVEEWKVGKKGEVTRRRREGEETEKSEKCKKIEFWFKKSCLIDKASFGQLKSLAH